MILLLNRYSVNSVYQHVASGFNGIVCTSVFSYRLSCNTPNCYYRVESSVYNLVHYEYLMQNHKCITSSIYNTVYDLTFN